MVVILSPGCYFECVVKMGWGIEQCVSRAGEVREAYDRMLF